MIQPVLPATAETPIPFPESLRRDKDALDALILENLDSGAGLVKQVGEHLIQAGGKRIRPLLVLLFARMLGYEGRSHIVLAAIIEFIHTASLIHDDVVDDARLRRGVPSANYAFGNAASVLVGDFLHTRAFQLMLSLENKEVMSILAETTNTIVDGELRQLMNLNSGSLDEAAYFSIIYAKTAKLFETSAVLGAIVAKADDQVIAKAAAFGKSLGLAFQLVDDCLDYEGQSDVMGKMPGQDLLEGKLTLPLVYAMHDATEDERGLIASYFNDNPADVYAAILDLVRQGQGLQYARQKAAEEIRQALQMLLSFPDNAYRQSLMQIAEFALTRQA